jgi:tetratricopeptide (TPR) repeat protein
VFRVESGVWVMGAARGDARGAERYAGEIMKAVVPGVKPEIEVSARFAYANTLLWRARYDEAIEQYTRIAEVYTPALHSPIVQAFGDDHGMYAACCEMMAQLFLGRFDRAREVMARAKRTSDTLADPLTRTMVAAHEILLRFFEGNQEAVLSVSSLVLSLSSEFGYHLWRSIAQLGHGWYRAVHGDHGGVDEARAGLAFWERLNQRVPITLWTGYVTHGLFALGRHDEALQTIDRTLADSAGTLDQLFEPELIRLRGEILLARDGDRAGALAQFRRAIERAREQKAGALELRAAVSLGELCARSSDLPAAREALEAALARVTGADEIPECRRARALLAELSAA